MKSSRIFLCKIVSIGLFLAGVGIKYKMQRAQLWTKSWNMIECYVSDNEGCRDGQSWSKFAAAELAPHVLGTTLRPDHPLLLWPSIILPLQLLPSSKSCPNWWERGFRHSCARSCQVRHLLQTLVASEPGPILVGACQVMYVICSSHWLQVRPGRSCQVMYVICTRDIRRGLSC